MSAVNLPAISDKDLPKTTPDETTPPALRQSQPSASTSGDDSYPVASFDRATSDSSDDDKSLAPRRLNIGGLHVAVFGLDAALSSSNPHVGVLVTSHGRSQDMHSLKPLHEGVLQRVKELESTSRRSARSLVIVTLDQRNHGERLVNADNNEAFHKNPTHALDMYSTFRGTQHDISYLMDFLPAFLFPRGEKTIDEFFVTGVSLGGHATWATLRHDPRVKIGVPIIGCPDYKALLAPRIRKRPPPGGPNELVPPVWPDTFDRLLAQQGVVECDYRSNDPTSNPYYGKRILVLGGADDRLVPPHIGDTFFNGLNVGPQGAKRQIIEPGAGHECTPAMIRHLADWIWEHGLSESVKSSL